VLLDPSVSYTTEDSLTLLAELSNRTPPVPVGFTAQDNLTARLAVAEPAHMPFAAPVPPVQEVCTQMLQHLDRVAMVVDDDPQILLFWGFTRALAWR